MSDIDQINMRTVIEAQVKLAVIRWYSLMAACGVIAFCGLIFLLWWSSPVDRWQDQCVKYMVPAIDQHGNAILVLPTKTNTEGN